MKCPRLFRTALCAAASALLPIPAPAQPPPAPAGNVMSAAKSTPPAPRFSNPAAIDFAALLPAPPAPDSVAGQAELDVVRQVQAWRTAEQIAWAKSVERDSVFQAASAVAPWYTAENLPRTAAFFQELNEDLRAIDRAAKQPFLRPRPSAVDPVVQPCVALPTSSSYPSGSAIQAFVFAELLAEFFPAKRAELEARAHRAAWGRVLGGVHYPSDLTAGRRLAPVFLAQCRQSAAFRAGLEECRKEVAAVAAKQG